MNMEFFLTIGIIFCPIHIIYKLFYRIKYKVPFKLLDFIFLILCFLFVAILIVIDIIFDYAYGFIYSFKIVLCGLVSLILPCIVVSKIIKFFNS